MENEASLKEENTAILNSISIHSLFFLAFTILWIYTFSNYGLISNDMGQVGWIYVMVLGPLAIPFFVYDSSPIHFFLLIALFLYLIFLLWNLYLLSVNNGKLRLFRKDVVVERIESDSLIKVKARNKFGAKLLLIFLGVPITFAFLYGFILGLVEHL